MSERIDHAAEARRLQGGAREIVRTINGDPALQPHMAAVIMLDDARLEAQLAMVEQQRIANLIAYVAKWTDDEVLDVDAEIREALGLS